MGYVTIDINRFDEFNRSIYPKLVQDGFLLCKDLYQ